MSSTADSNWALTSGRDHQGFQALAQQLAAARPPLNHRTNSVHARDVRSPHQQDHHQMRRTVSPPASNCLHRDRREGRALYLRHLRQLLLLPPSLR